MNRKSEHIQFNNCAMKVFFDLIETVLWLEISHKRNRTGKQERHKYKWNHLLCHYLSLWNNNNQLDFDACNVFSCPWIAGLQSPRTFILDTGMPANDQRSMPNRFDQIDVSVNWFMDQARCQACQTPLIHNGHRLTGAVLTDITLLKRLILHVPFKTVVIVAFGWLPLFLWSFYDATYLRVTFGSKVNKIK